MLARMSTTTFLGWQTYADLEPFGEYRSELRHGQQMAHMHNLKYFNITKPEQKNASDFMNFITKPEEKILTAEEAQTKIDADVFGL